MAKGECVMSNVLEITEYLLEETFIVHPTPSGRVYVEYWSGQFHARLWDWDDDLTILVTDTSPCMLDRWQDVEVGMACLFDAVDAIDIPLVGHPYEESIDEWRRLFPFLQTEPHGRVPRLVYLPNSRPMPQIINHELQESER